MILLFPDLDTLRLAVTTGIVPADVALVPAAVSTDADGRVFVETDAKLPKKARDDLDRLKVVGTRRHAGDTPERVSCWLQIFPTTRDPAPPKLSSQAPVLFELASPDLLPGVVGEMLRLGNDRQGFRQVAGDGPDPRVLLRVIGPPYYTLLRALDRLGGPGETVRAYVEQAPRVWVEIGHSHPFANQIRLDEGQVLLIRAPRDWAYLPDAPFRDIYDLLQFQLPTAPTAWEEAPVEGKLTVPLRLAPGNAADQPELWVIRGRGVDQLDALVRDADDRLTEQLTFAVATGPDGAKTVVLRTRPSKKQPPVLALEGAVGFKPFWKLPNLYLPAGTRLHPTVRREAVRKLLAEDTDTLVWLYPDGHGAFTPEGVPEDSFRPLQDWVEYVIDANRETLAAWVEATGFDFDHFICSDTTPPKPKAPPEKGPRDKDRDDSPLARPTTTKGGKKAGEDGTKTVGAFDVPRIEIKPPSEWKVRRDELEKAFLGLDGPLDDPARVRLWPELAAANAGMAEEASRDEAAVCWVNAMWGYDAPPPGYVGGWLRSELPAGQPTVTAAEFDQRMKPQEPTPGEMRTFASSLLWAAYQSPQPAWLRDRLPAVQKYLEVHEDRLPVRAVWLAAVRLAQLAGTDVLGLARVRDRLLQRLLDHGLSPERDLPRFLRNAGRKDSDRLRVIQERAHEVHAAARAWAEKSLKPAGSGTSASDTQNTLAYIDLMFAFGMAKLGERTPAQTLVEAARKALAHNKPADAKAIGGTLLFKAFKFRVDQALSGKPLAGLLDPAVLAEVDDLQKQGTAGTNNPYMLGYYAVSRFREQSRILDPQEKTDPYAYWMKHADELKKALAELPREKDPATLARKIREYLREGVKGKASAETRLFVLHDALLLAPRVGEAFTVELLQLVPETLRLTPAGVGPQAPVDLPKKQGHLLERALFLAAHFDRTEIVQKLVDQFIGYVRAKPDEQRFELVNVVAGQCLRSLRKLGLRDEIDKLLRRMQDEVLKGKAPAQLRQEYAARPDLWADVLQTLLNLAGGWLTFGLVEQAAPILEAARQEVLSGAGKVQVLKFTKLAQTYVAALGQGPAEFGMPRIVELFETLDPARITNTFTTAPYYSRLHLNLVEEVVLAIVSDDFALGQAGRRWLDEDEYLVRRRIHQDMRRHLETSGL